MSFHIHTDKDTASHGLELRFLLQFGPGRMVAVEPVFTEGDSWAGGNSTQGRSGRKSLKAAEMEEGMRQGGVWRQRAGR